MDYRSYSLSQVHGLASADGHDEVAMIHLLGDLAHTIDLVPAMYCIELHKGYLHWWPMGTNEYLMLCSFNDASTIHSPHHTDPYSLLQSVECLPQNREGDNCDPSSEERSSKCNHPDTLLRLVVIDTRENHRVLGCTSREQ